MFLKELRKIDTPFGSVFGNGWFLLPFCLLLCFLELRPTQRNKKLRKKKGEKKSLRVSSSEDSEETDAIVQLTVSEFHRIINRITKIEEEAKH